MSKFSSLHHHLSLLCEPIRESLSKAHYNPPDGSNVSVKSFLESLIPQKNPSKTSGSETVDFILCCAALAASETSTSVHLSWIPNSLCNAGKSAFRELSKVFSANSNANLLIELMPEVLPILKSKIKESCIDKGDDGDEISAASARTPVVYAVVASYQFRWLVTQVDGADLGKMCNLVIPCSLTTLDHWSPEVKEQGMITFIHLAKNVNVAEFGLYEDVILDACCQNVASSDETWEYEVEMSVLLLTRTQQNNPRSLWYEKVLNEMLSHLERQPRNKERRLAWLKHIEPVFIGLGLVLLSHFRRIFLLLFQWMHADDDETVLLVLDRLITVIKLTWIRNSPYIERSVDELVALYKESALKIAREDIRARILQILVVLQQCKGQLFEAAWGKHKNDPDLTSVCPYSAIRNAASGESFLVATQ